MPDSLPAGWSTASVAELIREPLANGRSVPTAKQGFPVLRLTALRNGRIDLSARKVGAWTARAAAPYLVAEGDFFVARGSGSIRLVGRGGLLESVVAPVAYPDTLIRIRLHEQAVSPRYFALVWDSSAVRSQIERKAKTTAGIYKINQPDIESCQLLLPPLQEQLNIAAALESYLTRLDDGIATLERVQGNLKRYRASVFQAAVEGRLVPTEADVARAEGRDYEPASVLLERILAERRRRWEDIELARMKARGQDPTDGKWRRAYREPFRPDTADCPELPSGWIWVTLDMVAEVKGGVTKGQRAKPGQVTREVPYLRVANVQRGYLDLSSIKTIQATLDQIDDLRLAPGDILFNEGGDRDKLGRGWVWRGELAECIHQNHVFRARPVTAEVVPEFVSWYGNTVGQRYFLEQGKQTTNLASINLTKLRYLPLPLPPIAEQLRIRDQVDALLSVAVDGEHTTAVARRRSLRLRQSILKYAFEGKLVEQDPNDEPASVLLERTRAARSQVAADNPVKRGRRLRSGR
jgi:type I restriction enzyme S subunit